MQPGMVIKESIEIHAPLKKVWENFIDLTCWVKWNTVMQNIRTNEQQLTSGKKLFCSFRPFFFPIKVKISVDEVIPYKRVVWSARKKGLTAFHEFVFHGNNESVIVTSSETLTGVLAGGDGILLPKKRLVSLTRAFLHDLKRVAET
jgi:hypothetical protein